MSIDATTAMQRVSEIQQLVQTITGGGAPAREAGFATALTAAQAAPALAGAPAAAPAAAGGGAVSGVPFANEINAAAARHGLDPALLAGLVQQESGFNPSARSSAGATGLTQLMPATARSLGVTDATDPLQALEGGAKYLKQMLTQFGGDQRLALAAYNAGPGAVQRHGGIPPYAETQNYVEKVLANAARYAAQTAPITALQAPLNATAPTASMPVDRSSTPAPAASGSGLGYPIT